MQVSIKIYYWALTGRENWIVYRFTPKVGVVKLTDLAPYDAYCSQYAFDRYFPKTLEITSLSEDSISVLVPGEFLDSPRTITTAKGETAKARTTETDSMYGDDVTSEERFVEVTYLG